MIHDQLSTVLSVQDTVVDILGLNPVSRKILANAAAAIVGMSRHAGFITEGAMNVKRKLEACRAFCRVEFARNGF